MVSSVRQSAARETQVFRALADPTRRAVYERLARGELAVSELLASWLMPNDRRPVVGHRFTMRAQPQGGWDGVVHCEVQIVEPPSLLRYSWRGGSGDVETLLDSVVTWRLTPTAAGGTLLRLEH